MTDLTVIILTRDEALHLPRALASVQGIATRVVVVDSGSTDATVQIAQAAGAEVWQHPWTTHAQQFNWALDRLYCGTGWVLRLDADEYVTPALGAQIAAGLPARRLPATRTSISWCLRVPCKPDRPFCIVRQTWWFPALWNWVENRQVWCFPTPISTM